MHNPYEKEENFAEGYERSIDELKGHPEQIMLDKLCYLVFIENENGKKLLEELYNRYVLAPLAAPGSATFREECVYSHGFSNAFRLLKQFADTHKHRIATEKSNGSK